MTSRSVMNQVKIIMEGEQPFLEDRH